MYPKTVLIFRPDRPMVFTVGVSKITVDGVETKTSVSKILAIPILRFVKVYLSNGNSITFSGLPYQVDIGENPFV